MSVEIKRDRWDRPILPHPMTGVNEAYTRASTLSRAIDNTYDLERWKQRRLAVGLGERPDLIAKVQSRPDDKKLLNEIVDNALEVAGSSTGANLGTAIHTFCEMVDQGESLPKSVEKRIHTAVDLYTNTMDEVGLKIEAVEQFVATRSVMSAGTFDRIVSRDGQYFIADIKTGANAPDYAHSTAVQMAVYSRGTLFHPEKGWGDRLPEDIRVDQYKGILIHLPATGKPVCNLYWVDLDSGWKMARVAHRVRTWWKEKPTELIS